MSKLSKSTKRRRVLDELEIQLENNDQYCTEALSDGDIINQDNNIMYCCDSLSDTIDYSS